MSVTSLVAISGTSHEYLAIEPLVFSRCPDAIGLAERRSAFVSPVGSTSEPLCRRVVSKAIAHAG